MSPTLDGIRYDHKARYEFAAKWIHEQTTEHVEVADMGSGCGYGSHILAQSGCQVLSIDIDDQALKYGEEHYGHDCIERVAMDISQFNGFGRQIWFAAAFEVIEHVPDGGALIAKLHECGVEWLIGSVPNESVVPFGPKVHRQHFRHYTPDQLRFALQSNGFDIDFLGGQCGKHGAEGQVLDGPDGCRTIVFAARRK